MNPTKCPCCSASSTPGFTTLPVSEDFPMGRIMRCEVCEGTAMVTIAQVIGWEMSL